MDERFFQRPVDEGTPSVVRPTHDPNAHFHIPPGDPYGQAYCHIHSLYPDGTPAICPPATETPEIYYPARFDKEQHVLSSRPRSTPDHVQEVMRYQTADQPPRGRVELALLEPIYRYVQRAREGVTERPPSKFLWIRFPPRGECLRKELLRV